MVRACVRSAACLAVSLVVLPAFAAEGRIPVFASSTLTTPGRYIVTRNIAGTGAGPVIDILAPNVDLDLNGFTLDNNGFAFPVIQVSAPPAEVVIHDGTLLGGTTGIEAPLAGNKVVIDNVEVQGAAGNAIHLVDIANVAIRKTVLSAVGGSAILVDGAAPRTGTIEDNVINGIAGDGIAVVAGVSIGVLGNRISGGPASASGIRLDNCIACLVSENTVTQVSGEGIAMFSGRGGKLYDNVVRDAGSHGIHLDAATREMLVLSNTASNCGAGLPGGHGLFVEGILNHIDRNVLNSNNGYGLRFAAGSASNTFGRNTARGNGGAAAGPCAGVPTLFPPESCNDGGLNTTFGDNLIPGPPVF